MSYSLEDLLKASAETLGRGTLGSTYKAVMESGFIVTVKRLRDARYRRLEEFKRHMDLIGPDFESCLTDYGLTLFRDPDSVEEPSVATFFYKALECRDIRKSSTQPANVYSFEVTEYRDEPNSSNEASERKLQALLNIAMAFVALTPENRSAMREVLKMIRTVRAEAQVSSNSSDHSSRRWSDTVQSLPKDEHLSI
ncbi:hypothetical protein REPUB_Repub09cG0132000 [Reevesia pubescens]